MSRIVNSKAFGLGSPNKLSVFLTGLLLAVFLISCGENEAVDAVPARPVKTIRVRAASGNPHLTLPARVRAHRRVELAFKEVSGPLVKLPIEGREGEQVEKGELLARALTLSHTRYGFATSRASSKRPARPWRWPGKSTSGC